MLDLLHGVRRAAFTGGNIQRHMKSKLESPMRGAVNALGLLACFLLLQHVPLFAQQLPETSQPPEKKPAGKPARIIVETSPQAQVYLDDVFKGQASSAGHLVIESPKPGEHTVRITLAGKKDYEKKVTVAAGGDTTIRATLAEPEQPAAAPQPSPRVEPTPRRTTEAPTAGTVRQNSKDGLKYVWIPAGSFTMGCSPGDTECFDSEKPPHQVTITKGFWIAQTPTTVAAYKRLAAAGKDTPSAPNFNANWTNDNMPIVNVSWNDSQAYCQWAGGRLPTEAEWEYAARGGSTDARYGPLDDVAWYADNSGRQRLDSAEILKSDSANYVKRLNDNGNGTHDVAQKRANGFGLYDTLGNVWQWVNDWYDANYYQSSPSSDPTGPSSGQYRVLRGGSWGDGPRYVRVSGRLRIDPGSWNFIGGFRCVGEANIP